ncbi:hypothetical protein ALC57_09078, partial [Trachymyrmex cornetzi]
LRLSYGITVHVIQKWSTSGDKYSLSGVNSNGKGVTRGRIRGRKEGKEKGQRGIYENHRERSSSAKREEDRERKKKRQLHEQRRGSRGRLSKDEELCKKRDETGRIPRDKRRCGRRRRRNGGTKEDHAGDYNINKQMSLEAGEFAIQSGTGGGREAESPPTNLEGLTRTLAPSLDLSSPFPACLSFTKFLLLAHCPGISSLSLSLSPPLLCGSRFCVYKTRRARFDAKTTVR